MLTPLPAAAPATIYGYARVSTRGQDWAYQMQKLEAAGCATIFREKRSGKNTEDRPQLRRLLARLKPGDLVLATVTDRIARDPLDLLTILRATRAAGAGLRLLDEPFIDTTHELADLVLFAVGWAAQWQRRRILENTANGRVLARARGVRFGRKPKLSAEARADALRRRAKGEPIAVIARDHGVSASTISRLRCCL